MDIQHVFVEASAIGELLSTHLAREGLFPCVYAHVTLQIPLCVECFFAEVAFKRLVTNMPEKINFTLKNDPSNLSSS